MNSSTEHAEALLRPPNTSVWRTSRRYQLRTALPAHLLPSARDDGTPSTSRTADQSASSGAGPTSFEAIDGSENGTVSVVCPIDVARSGVNGRELAPGSVSPLGNSRAKPPWDISPVNCPIGRSWPAGWVAAGSYPPAAPTVPGVPNSGILCCRQHRMVAISLSGSGDGLGRVMTRGYSTRVLFGDSSEDNVQ